MSSPLISAIIPVYNREAFTVDAVQSVLQQTFTDLECIVVDDGSTDNTPELLAEIDDPRLVVIRQENKGVSSARNRAIAAMRGEYAALLDSDDRWLPKKLEKQLSFMRENDLHISQTDEIWFRKGKRVNQGKKHAKPEGWFFEQSLKMCLVSPSCVMLSRKFWDDCGPFDESMPACEDYDLWLRAGLYYPVGLLRERLTEKQGGRPDQLSNAVPCLDLWRIRAMIKILGDPVLTAEQREAVLEEMRNKAHIYVLGCRKRGRQQEADRLWTLICNIMDGKMESPDEIVQTCCDM